jgi:hypothetical protein
MENIAMNNRYSRSSQITVVNDSNWTAKTYKIMDLSEPGFTDLNVWEIANPTEIVTTLQDIKTLENSLVNLSINSRVDAGILSISPRRSVMKTGAIAKREYNVTIPSNRANSVTEMWDIGSYGSVQGYIFGQAIFPAFASSVWSHILGKAQSFVVIATFADLSTINFEYNSKLGLLTTSFEKVDSTAQKDGKGYKNSPTDSSYDSPDFLEFSQGGGITSHYRTEKQCGTYTVSSNEGGTWTRDICYYVIIE